VIPDMNSDKLYTKNDFVESKNWIKYKFQNNFVKLY